MASFSFNTAAELFPAAIRKKKRAGFAYRRFGTAAEAVRFAIEELPADSLNGAYLQVDEARFDQVGIRTLYESQDFPLPRRPRTALGPSRPFWYTTAPHRPRRACAVTARRPCRLLWLDPVVVKGHAEILCGSCQRLIWHRQITDRRGQCGHDQYRDEVLPRQNRLVETDDTRDRQQRARNACRVGLKLGDR